MSFSDTLEKIREDAERIFEKKQTRNEKLQKEADEARDISSGVIYKIVLISASIVAFSVSLVSLDFIGEHINFFDLYVSWKLFFSVIVLGFFILFIEPRIRHALVWRYSIQMTEILGREGVDEELRKVSFFDKVKIWIALFSSIIMPQNLFFNRIRKTEKQTIKDVVLSCLLLSKIASFKKAAPFLENLLFVVFVLGLWFFLQSVQF